MEDWRTFVDFTTERRPLGKSKIHYRRFRQFTVEQSTIGRSTKICAVKEFYFHSDSWGIHSAVRPLASWRSF